MYNLQLTMPKIYSTNLQEFYPFSQHQQKRFDGKWSYLDDWNVCATCLGLCDLQEKTLKIRNNEKWLSPEILNTSEI